MKGVNFVTNENNEKVAVQIDLKTLLENQEQVEDFLDLIIAENRIEDEEIDWEVAKEELRKSGKL